MDVTLLYFDDCPHWHAAATLIDRLATELPDIRVHREVITTEERARQTGFRGSPTILIDGHDPWAREDAPVGLSCRMFITPNGPAGCPNWDQLITAVTTRRDD